MLIPRWILAGLLTAALAPWPAGAQAPPDSASAARACDGRTIAEVEIVNRSIFETAQGDSTDSGGWSRTLANLAQGAADLVHWTTRRSLIEGELLFRAGDCYDPLAVDESGRILRALPFLAEAEISVQEAGRDEVRVVVETRDDWTLKMDIRPEWDGGLRIIHAGITEENLFGTGNLAGFYYSERDEVRDLGVELRTSRLFGTRMDAHVEGGRTRTGNFLGQTMAYPFVGEVGRWSFVESWTVREDLFPFAASGGATFTNASLPVHTRVGEVSLARRFGDPGDLTVLGVGASWEDVRFDGFPAGVEVVAGFDFDNRLPADSATAEAIRPQVTPRRGGYLNVIVGKRNVRFESRSGLDGIRAEQDVRLGAEVLAAAGVGGGGAAAGEAGDGRSGGAPGGGRFVRGRLSAFGGAAGRSWVLSSELHVEGAAPIGSGAAGGAGAGAAGRGWTGSRGGGFEDIVAEWGTTLYWHPAESGRHTVVAGISGAGGWRNTLPFQLTLGGPYGVRGYDREEFPSAQRVVAHLEDRITLDGPFRDVADMGLAVFADAGAGWGGAAPFGVDSGLKASVGVGLRMAFPAGARRAVRIDFAAPLDELALNRIRFRIGADAVSLLSRFGHWQVRRSRSAVPAAEILGSR